MSEQFTEAGTNSDYDKKVTHLIEQFVKLEDIIIDLFSSISELKSKTEAIYEYLSPENSDQALGFDKSQLSEDAIEFLQLFPHEITKLNPTNNDENFIAGFSQNLVDEALAKVTDLYIEGEALLEDIKSTNAKIKSAISEIQSFRLDVHNLTSTLYSIYLKTYTLKNKYKKFIGKQSLSYDDFEKSTWWSKLNYSPDRIPPDDLDFDVISHSKQIASIFNKVCLANNIPYSEIEIFQRDFFGRLNLNIIFKYGSNEYNFELNYGGKCDYFNFRVNDLVEFFKLLNELKDLLFNSETAWNKALNLSTIWTLASEEDFLQPEIFLKKMIYQLQDGGLELLSNGYELCTFGDEFRKLESEHLIIHDIPTGYSYQDGPRTLGFSSSRNPLDINHTDKLHDVVYGITSDQEVTIYAVQMPKVDNFSWLSAQKFLSLFEAKLKDFYNCAQEIAENIRSVQNPFPEFLDLIDNPISSLDLANKLLSFISNLDPQENFYTNLNIFFASIINQASSLENSNKVISNLKYLKYSTLELKEFEKDYQTVLKVLPIIKERQERLKRFNCVKGGSAIISLLTSLAIFRKLGFNTVRFQLYFPLSRHIDIGKDIQEYVSSKMRRNLSFCKDLIPELNFYEEGSFIYLDLKNLNFEIRNPNKKSRVVASVLLALSNSSIQ